MEHDCCWKHGLSFNFLTLILEEVEKLSSTSLNSLSKEVDSTFLTLLSEEVDSTFLTSLSEEVDGTFLTLLLEEVEGCESSLETRALIQATSKSEMAAINSWPLSLIPPLYSRSDWVEPWRGLAVRN